MCFEKVQKKTINKLETKQKEIDMQNTNKEVTIAVKVDRKIAEELKRISKQKDYRFSSYVRRVLVNEVEKQKKESD